MSEEPVRRPPDDEDIEARFAAIVAGLSLTAPDDDLPRQPGPPDSEPPHRPRPVPPPPARAEPAETTPPQGQRPDTEPPMSGPRERAAAEGAAAEGAAEPPSPEQQGAATARDPQTWREWNDPDVEEHFVPPDPPPWPAGDLHFWGILVGMLGGPLILFLAHGVGVLYGSVWNWLGLGLSVGGFALLVLRLPTSRDDDPTGGARV